MLIKLDINLLDKWYVGTLFTIGFSHAHIRTYAHTDARACTHAQCERAVHSLACSLSCHLLSFSFEYRCLLKLKGTDNRFLYKVSFYQICLQSYSVSIFGRFDFRCRATLHRKLNHNSIIPPKIL